MYLTQIPEVYFSRMFGEERLIYDALDDLITEAKAMYSKSFPLLPPISRYDKHWFFRHI